MARMDAATAVATLLPGAGRDPFPAYQALRAHGPVVAHGGAYFVSGYAAADAVLRDATMSAYDAPLLDQQWSDWRSNRGVALFADSMLRQNPPNHTRMRRLASGVFTARRVGRLREVIAAQVDEALDELAAHAVGGTVDVITHLAYPLPIGVICALLGVPAADRAVVPPAGRRRSPRCWRSDHHRGGGRGRADVGRPRSSRTTSRR